MTELPPHESSLETKYALHAQKTTFELKTLNDKFTKQVELSEKQSEVIQKVSDQISETQKLLDKLNNKLDLSTQKLQTEIEKINALDAEQNRILDEHIAGVNTLKQMYQLEKEHVARRLNDLEAPRQWWSMTKKGIIGLAAVLGGLGTIGTTAYFIYTLFFKAAGNG